MKKKILMFSMSVLALGLFTASAYAYDYDPYYNGNVKSEVKRIDKGIQVTRTSDDSQVAQEIQEDVRYYESAPANGGYCCSHMGHMNQRGAYTHSYGCMW